MIDEIKITREQLEKLVPPGYRLVDTAVEKWTADGGYMWLSDYPIRWSADNNGLGWVVFPRIAPDLPPKPTPEQVSAMRWEGKPVELTGECIEPDRDHRLFVCAGNINSAPWLCYYHDDQGTIGRRWILRVVEPPAPKGRWVECGVRLKGCFYRFDYLPMATDLKLDTARSIVGYGGTKYEGLDGWHFDIKTDERGVMRRPVAVRFRVEE